MVGLVYATSLWTDRQAEGEWEDWKEIMKGGGGGRGGEKEEGGGLGGGLGKPGVGRGESK